MKKLLLTLCAVPLIGNILHADTGWKDTIQFTETDGSPKCMAGQVKVGAGQLTCSGQTATLSITGGSGGSSSLQVTRSGVQVSSPTSSLNFYSGDFNINLAGSTTGQIFLNPATTDFIRNSSTAESKTLNITSGTMTTFYSTNETIANSGSLILNPSASLLLYNGTGASLATIAASGSGATVNLQIGTGSGSGTTDLTDNVQLDIPGANALLATNSSAVIVSTTPDLGSSKFTGLLPVARGGTGTASPGLVAGTNITSITGTWPNQTINAATQSGGGGYSLQPATVTVRLDLGMTATTGTYTSSLTVTGAGGIGGTYGIVGGSLTASNLASGQCVQTGTGGILTVTGSACGSGGGGSSALQVTESGVQITSPTASINFYGGDFNLSAIGSTSTVYLAPDSTNYIRNTPTLQVNTTFYVSSGTVSGTLGVLTTLYVGGNSAASADHYFGSDGGAILNIQGTGPGIIMRTAADALAWELLNERVDQQVPLQMKLGKEVRFFDDTSTFYTSIRSSPTLTYNSVYQLPSSTGSAGQVLSINTVGSDHVNLQWITPSSGGGGGASTLAVGTGTAAGFTVPASSPVAVVNLDQSQFSATLKGSATSFITIAHSTAPITGNVTLTSTHSVVMANCSSACTITLPTAAGISGKIYWIKNIGASSQTNTVTVATTSSQTIDGATTQILTLQYTDMPVISDGTSWSIL